MNYFAFMNVLFIYFFNFELKLVKYFKIKINVVPHFLLFFQTSTQTHCEVDNFAPSISAAIGNYLPQKYVWQTCISLHISPRFLFLYLYKQFYETRLANPIGKFLFCCQNTCLCDFTLISRIFLFLFL